MSFSDDDIDDEFIAPDTDDESSAANAPSLGKARRVCPVCSSKRKYASALDLYKHARDITTKSVAHRMLASKWQQEAEQLEAELEARNQQQTRYWQQARSRSRGGKQSTATSSR
eukprot:jgi/Chlat1/3275/Chrsp22S03525